jgi:stalled ribosome rescue protein Dom34
MAPTIAPHHVAVWLDHHQAQIFRIAEDSFEESTIRADAHHVRRHPENHSSATHDAENTKRFFGQIARTLHSASEVLVVGPSTAKLHFLKYVHAHEPMLEPRIVGVETVDHPTDPQLAAFARKYFRAVDRMLGRAP